MIMIVSLTMLTKHSFINNDTPYLQSIADREKVCKHNCWSLVKLQHTKDPSDAQERHQNDDSSYASSGIKHNGNEMMGRSI